MLDLRTGKFRDAIRSFRRSQAIANDPYTTEGLALAYYSVGQFHLFQEAMMEAATQMPNDFAPAYYLGRYYVSVDMADFARGKLYLAAAVLHKPTHVLARYYLGFSQESLGDIEESVATYKEALRLTSHNASYSGLIYLGLARASMAGAQLQDAIAYAEQAEKLAPRDPEVHKILGRLYRETGQLHTAIDHWQMAASLDPTGTAPYYNLYRLYMQTAQISKANAALAQYKAMSSLYGAE
jgi:tetratricopeptide (TPR) repeat protein